VVVNYNFRLVFACSTFHLNNLISPDSGWTLKDATAINDNGQIVGYGDDGSGQARAFLLTPVPEPATLLLLALGGLAVIRRRR